MGGFISVAQLPIEALTEDPSMESQNEDLDIIDRLVEVKDGYAHRSAQIYFVSYC